MKKELNELLWDMVARIARKQQRAMAQVARIKIATCYVKGVQTMRLGALAHIGICLLCLLLVGGFILLHAGLFFCLPWTLEAKGTLLLVLGGVYFLVAIVVLAVLGSQRFWMRISRADEAVEWAVENKPLKTER